LSDYYAATFFESESMNNRVNTFFGLFVLIALCGTNVGFAQEKMNKQQKAVLATMEALSKTTENNGQGAKAYEKFLADDFNRWTIGSSKIDNKEDWVGGVNSWFEEGWRVSKREQKNLEILVLSEFAHTRRIVTETYLGPNGDTSKSTAALAEVWILSKGKWLLLRVNVHPMDSSVPTKAKPVSRSSSKEGSDKSS